MKILAPIFLVAAFAAPAAADDQGYGPGYGVPRGHMPPPGQCRVWYPGRPPGQQPPPTDCARAQYEAARYGGRVLYSGAAASHGEQRRGGDGRWTWVCVSRDWHGHCLRSERRPR